MEGGMVSSKNAEIIKSKTIRIRRFLLKIVQSTKYYN
jgi:hypothetical protein